MKEVSEITDAIKLIESYIDNIDDVENDTTDIEDAIYLIKKDIEIKDDALKTAIENKFEPDKWLWYAKQAL